MGEHSPAPHHVGEWKVGEGYPGARKGEPRGELHAAGKGTGDNGRRNNGERGLETDVDDVGITSTVLTAFLKLRP